MPPCHPLAYWPRLVCLPSSRGRVTARSTFSFSMRTSSAAKDSGSSIAVSASSCSRWFWITSRAAPMPS